MCGWRRGVWVGRQCWVVLRGCLYRDCLLQAQDVIDVTLCPYNDCVSFPHLSCHSLHVLAELVHAGAASMEWCGIEAVLLINPYACNFTALLSTGGEQLGFGHTGWPYTGLM